MVGQLDFARKVKKPVFIAEATPRGHFFDKEDPDEVWEEWFEKFFAHMEKNIDVVHATSYINANWDAQDMWDGWGADAYRNSSLNQDQMASENGFCKICQCC